MSEQFCIKKTPEEVKKEMEETTRKELEKLTQQIKNNPSLLKPNMAYDSDTDSDYESSSSDSSSSSSSSSSRSKTKYKTKINKNAIDIFKKETTIDKLEEKNYYKTLELSNLILENSKLKEENINFQKIISDYVLQSKIISEVIELSKNEPLKVNGHYLINEDLNIANMNSKIFFLQKEFDKYNTQINKLITDLNSLSDSSVKAFYNQELAKINITVNKNYEFNNKMVDAYITKTKNREKWHLIMIILSFAFFMMIVKDYLMFNFLDEFVQFLQFMSNQVMRILK